MEKTETNLFENPGKSWFDWKTWRAALWGSMGMVCALVIMGMSVWMAVNPVGTYSAGETVTPTSAAATQEAKRVEYYLPYPGILPDSPLYKLKAIRDRVKLWLTFDEGKKAELELALADKRVNAALALAEGNKPEIAVSTATKAEKYLEQSVNRVIKLIKSGKDEKSLLGTLNKATAKHAEVLVGIRSRVGEEGARTLMLSMELNKLLTEQVGQAAAEAK